VRLALGRADLDLCSSFDANRNGVVDIDEVVQGVANALHPPL